MTISDNELFGFDTLDLSTLEQYIAGGCERHHLTTNTKQH